MFENHVLVIVTYVRTSLLWFPEQKAERSTENRLLIPSSTKQNLFTYFSLIIKAVSALSVSKNMWV